ncbi:MAG: serine/threonine-protein kinase [Acidimicrobiia bacterium]
MGTDRLLNRPIALTILNDDLRADTELVERFHHYARQWSKISDRSVVRVYDIVRDHDADVVITERSDGTDLGASLTGTPLAVESVTTTMIAVTDALEVLHRAGTLHLGLHAGAILLRPDGRVLVTEPGMARLADHRDQAEVTCVAPELLLGTPVGPATDLYAIGALLYYCLTGAAPFAASSTNATAMARLHRDPTPIRKRRPNLPEPLALAVEACLARNPSARPQSASELRTLLTDASSVTTSRPKRTGRRWAVVGSAALAVVVATTVASALPRRSEPGTATVPVTNPASSAPGTPFIVALGEFDPAPGDGRENPRQLGALTDGNPQTVWTTERYNVRDLGRKGGVGLVFELSSTAPLGSLDVSSPSRGWAAEVFVADQLGPKLTDWGTSIARADSIAGNVTFSLSSRSGRYILLWITDLGDTKRGSWYTLQISGVALTA